MKKRNHFGKRYCTLALAGMMAATGVSVYSPMVPAIIAEAAGQTYNTQGGVVTMGTGTASIILNGNSGQTLVGKQFEVYKLFNAENAKDGESINYTFNAAYEQAVKNVVAKGLSKDGKTVAPADVTEYMAVDYIQSLNTNPVEGANTPQTLEGRYSLFRYFIEDLRDEMVSLGMSGDLVNVKNVRSDNSIRLNGLDYGYYIVDEVTNVEETHSAASLCMVDTANSTANITVKSDYPSVTKKIQEDDANKDITDADNWNDIGDYEIGQTVPYKYESDIPDINGYETYYYAFHDVMDEALTFDKNSVKIVVSGDQTTGGTSAHKEYTLKSSEYTINTNPGNGDTFQITVEDIKSIVDREFPGFDDLGQNKYGQTVTVTYNAVLNDNAALDTGRPGFENDVRLEFSNNPDSDGDGSTGFTPWDTVVCFTYQLDTIKLNDHDKELSDAKFRLYSDADCKNEVYVKEGNGGYIVINRDSTGGEDHTGGKEPANAVEMVSGTDGTFVIYGLDSGTYYLKETDAPDGYRQLLDPIELTLTATYTTDRDAYIKGDGATTKTLQAFDATANIKTFYSGVFNTEKQVLETEVENGSANLTVINEVGMKLPVTGTSTALILVIAGGALMAFALVKTRKQKKADDPHDQEG